MGTQKNRLDETVLLSTQNTCLNCWVRNNSQFYAKKGACLSESRAFNIVVPFNVDEKQCGSDQLALSKAS